MHKETSPVHLLTLVLQIKSALVEDLSSDMFLVIPAASGPVTKGLQSQFREVRPGFGPALKLALYWKVILPLLLGVRSKGMAVWVVPFLHLPNIRHSLRAVPDKLRGT